MQAKNQYDTSLFDAVIFDFDGVILDSEPLHYKACCHILNDIGLKINYEEYKEKCVGLADKEMFPRLLSDKSCFLSAEEINFLIKKKINKYNEFINHCETLPVIKGLDQYIHELLIKIRKIAICSGSARSEIITVLSKLKPSILTTYFNPIITAEDVQYGKPNPEGYLLAAKRLGVVPKRCLVVEDAPHGVTAAKSAGMYVVALLTTYSKEQLKDADNIVDNFADLI